MRQNISTSATGLSIHHSKGETNSSTAATAPHRLNTTMNTKVASTMLNAANAYVSGRSNACTTTAAGATANG